MRRRISALRISGLIAGWVAVWLGVPARKAHAAPTAATNSSPSVHVRLWKTDLHSFNRVRILYRTSGRRAATVELGGGGPGYLFNNYADIPSGPTVFTLVLDSDKKPVRTVQADLLPETFATLIVSEPERAGSPPQLELVDDGTVTTSDTSAQLRLRFLVPGLKEARITVGDVLNAEIVTADGYLRIRGLKPAVYPIHTFGTSPVNKPFSWNNEVDLSQHRRQTLLIYPDPYGRIRPRLIEDAELPAASANEDGQR